MEKANWVSQQEVINITGIAKNTLENFKKRGLKHRKEKGRIEVAVEEIEKINVYQKRLTNIEIAEKLMITDRTVKTYIKNGKIPSIEVFGRKVVTDEIVGQILEDKY